MEGIIYKYTSPSGKCYIGQTINESSRKRAHSKKQGGKCLKFYSAVDKYGFDNFKYEVLVRVYSEHPENLKLSLDNLEIQFIKTFDSFENGYNMTTGGSGSKNLIVSNDTREKQSSLKKGKTPSNIRKVIKRNVDTYEILEEFESVTKAAESMNSAIGSISAACNRTKSKRGYYKGFIWDYK